MKTTKKDNRLVWAGGFFAAFILLIVALRFIDVKPSGVPNTQIGLASLNLGIHNLIGVHMSWYSITNVLGYATLLLAAGFGLLGLIQLIRRKSLYKVDLDIVLLGILYVLVLLLYALFEVLVINYRPVILEGNVPEPSFPSSHTMLALVILGTALYQFRTRIPKQNIRVAINLLCLLVMVVLVIGRLISGVHWFTDIFGAVLLGESLILVYNYAVERFQ